MSRGIYKIINVINNKFYVGSAVNFVERKRKHWWMLRKGTHANKHLQAAWIKYGEQAFVFVVVEDLPDDIDLLAAENVWLKEHVGKGYCYNLATNATAPTLGWYGEKNPMWGKTFSHTEEAKIKIAAASTGRRHTPEDIEKIRQQWIGKPKSAEVRAKISATLSGEGNFWFGKKRPDHGAKVSRAVVATTARLTFAPWSGRFLPNQKLPSPDRVAEILARTSADLGLPIHCWRIFSISSGVCLRPVEAAAIFILASSVWEKVFPHIGFFSPYHPSVGAVALVAKL